MSESSMPSAYSSKDWENLISSHQALVCKLLKPNSECWGDFLKAVLPFDDGKPGNSLATRYYHMVKDMCSGVDFEDFRSFLVMYLQHRNSYVIVAIIRMKTHFFSRYFLLAVQDAFAKFLAINGKTDIEKNSVQFNDAIETDKYGNYVQLNNRESGKAYASDILEESCTSDSGIEPEDKLQRTKNETNNEVTRDESSCDEFDILADNKEGEELTIQEQLEDSEGSSLNKDKQDKSVKGRKAVGHRNLSYPYGKMLEKWMPQEIC